MTVDATPVYQVFTVTRETAGEVYPISFPYIAPEYVKCYYAVDNEQTNLVYGRDYTVNTETNELTVTGSIPIDAKFVVYRVTDLTQEILWVDGQAVYTPDIMQADDKAMHILQELAEQTNRAVKVTREAEAEGVHPEDRWEEIEEAREQVLVARDKTVAARDETIATKDAALNEISNAKQDAVDTITTDVNAIEKLKNEAVVAATQAQSYASVAIKKADAIKDLTAEANTLSYPSAATAEYDNEMGKLFLGIPEGKPGENGKDGKNGLDGRNGDDGLPPAHMWDGTNLSFQNPDGTWGQAVNLKGDVGPQGQAPSIDVIDCGGACDFKLTQIDAGMACSFAN